MTDKEALRQTSLQDTNTYGQKRRFGLFSQPISTAIGDDGPYKTKLHPRDDDGHGKPITEARNFFSGPCRTGQMRKSFLGDLNSLAASNTKDEYIEVPKRLLYEENETFKNGFKNQNKFKPPSGTGSNILAKGSYEYVEDKPAQKDPKRNREDDGRVKTKPRNYYTNQQSTILTNTDCFKYYKHMDDPYDRAHQLELQKMKKDKSLEPEAKFKPNSFHAKTFNKDRQIYDLSENMKPKQMKQTKFNIYKHQTKWKTSSPNKHGLYGYFSPFPKYMENPPREITRKPPVEKKDVFKKMSSTLTTPTASITNNQMNMRRYVNHSFSLHK